jgi:hypothetical protein
MSSTASSRPPERGHRQRVAGRGDGDLPLAPGGGQDQALNLVDEQQLHGGRAGMVCIWSATLAWRRSRLVSELSAWEARSTASMSMSSEDTPPL